MVNQAFNEAFDRQIADARETERSEILARLYDACAEHKRLDWIQISIIVNGGRIARSL